MIGHRREQSEKEQFRMRLSDGGPSVVFRLAFVHGPTSTAILFLAVF
jgi:hypothetical protein